MIQFKDLIKEDFLKRFKIYYPQGLFEPDWSMLHKQRCPICGLKLKIPLKGKVAFCKSKKHLRTFTIKLETLNKLK